MSKSGFGGSSGAGRVAAGFNGAAGPSSATSPSGQRGDATGASRWNDSAGTGPRDAATKAELLQRLKARATPIAGPQLVPPGVAAARIRQRLDQLNELRIAELTARLDRQRGKAVNDHRIAAMPAKKDHDRSR